jgi:predicted transcriptional regulator
MLAEITREPVANLPLRPLLAAPPDMAVRQLVQAMRRRRLGAAVVVNEGGEPIGCFNERLLMRMLLNGPEQLDQPVQDHMDSRIVCIGLNDPIPLLIQTMQQHNVRWVCVLDEAGRAHSITGCRGVFEYLVDHFPRSVMVHPLRSRLTMSQREGA